MQVTFATLIKKHKNNFLPDLLGFISFKLFNLRTLVIQKVVTTAASEELDPDSHSRKEFGFLANGRASTY